MWKRDLSLIHDPADMFAYVSKSEILPEKATDFAKMILSSDTITNATRYFFIDKNDTWEKTGNVTFFVRISAFNQNHSVYNLM
jgi:hypothetical protein